MIAISIDDGFGSWDNYSLSIEEAQDKINELETAIDEASNAQAFRLKGIIEQLQEAIAEHTTEEN
jgi:hypothetical protein